MIGQRRPRGNLCPSGRVVRTIGKQIMERNMASGESHDKDDSQNVVLREMRSKENARFLHGISAFKLEDALPGGLKALLDDLSRAENGRQAGGDQSGALGATSGPQRK